MNAKERIEFLRAEIEKHDRLYEQNQPIISDTEYDKRFQELVELEQQHPEYVDPSSPTQRIITEFVDSLEKRTHPAPLLSLKKAKTTDAVTEFVVQIGSPVVVEDKLDGLTIELYYGDGDLTEAVTRGNGVIGEVVTHTIRTVRNVPKRILFKGHIRVRGEAVIPRSEFERINEERLEAGEELYSHPRNLASGTVRQLDSSVAAQRGLQFFAYDLTHIEGGPDFETDTEQRNFLLEQGFTLPMCKVFEPAEFDQLPKFIEDYAEVRKTLAYLIDGLVIKSEDLAQREELGSTSKTPRWAISYKFAALFQHTVLRALELQLGRTGVVAPVAVFDPVDLDGAMTTRATLHNFDHIKKLDLRIADTIVVERSNDVIPKVLGIVPGTERGEKPIETPTHCPDCGTELVFEGAYLKCPNDKCRAVFIKRLAHFASRDALNIEGLGESIAEVLVQQGLVRELPDLLRLNEVHDKLIALDGFGKRKVQKLLDAIEAAKSVPMDRAVYSLGAPMLGRTVSRALTAHFPNMDALMDASYDELVAIDGVGSVVASTIHGWFAEPANRAMVNELRSLGLKMEPERKERAGDALAGKTLVITGTLSHPRSYYEELIEAHGGKSSSSVSKKTDYLLCGEDAGSKLDKAQKLNVPVLTEEEFMALLH